MHSLNIPFDVTIRPATPSDKSKIYTWLAHSNLTPEMLGEPNFPDNPVPSWDEFDKDYTDHYFDDTKPMKGRCYIILKKQEEVGQINYNAIDHKTKTTEIDIWLADKKHTGQGIGPMAIKLLCNHLFEDIDCRRIIIQPSARNIHAVKAYKKAGFTQVKNMPKNFKLDYHDSVVLAMNFFK